MLIKDVQFTILQGETSFTSLGTAILQTDIVSTIGENELSGLFTISPNPFKESATFQIQMPSDGNVTIEISTITGQRVDYELNQHFTKGAHGIPFSAMNFDSGLYLLKITFELQDNTIQIFRKLIIN